MKRVTTFASGGRSLDVCAECIAWLRWRDDWPVDRDGRELALAGGPRRGDCDMCERREHEGPSSPAARARGG